MVEHLILTELKQVGPVSVLLVEEDTRSVREIGMVWYTASHKYDMFVELTNAEVDEAMVFGESMFNHSQGRGLRDYIPDKTKGKRAQSIGSLAERAGSKGLGLPWTQWVDTFHQPDLHHNVEVRLIGVDRYGLRVYDKDHDSRRVLGVVIEKGRERMPYRIPGWIYAKDAKCIEYKMDPLEKNHPMYAVPQTVLRDPRELIEIIKCEQGGSCVKRQLRVQQTWTDAEWWSDYDQAKRY